MYVDDTNFLFDEEEIVESLYIQRGQLTAIIKELIFNNQLTDNDHFRICNKKYQEKIFSKQGAFIIADYLDTKGLISDSEIQEFVNLISDKNKDFINQLVRKKEQQLLRYKVTEVINQNCTSLTKINNRHFLSRIDTINILQTTVEQLDQIFFQLKRIRPPEGLIIDEDFCNIATQRYYSFSGLAKFSQQLSKIIPEKENYYTEFSNIGNSVLETRTRLLPHIPDRKQIDYMKRKARERDYNTCQVTGIQGHQNNRYEVQLTVHHLYDESHYPYLAADIDNLITITKKIHDDFHIHFNGATIHETTIDLFIKYIETFHYNKESLITELYERKRRIEHMLLYYK
jgi:5-methylcytosine-specific restriction endonuclease McrA